MTLNRAFILKIAALVAFGLCLALVVYAIAAAPRGDGKRLGLRGLKRERALEVSEIWRYFEPLVRWIGARVEALVPPAVRQSLNEQIGAAGDFLGLLPEELVGLGILSCVAGLGVGYFVGAWTGLGALSTMGFCALGAIAPFLALSDRRATRFKEVSRRLPSAIDILALGMGAGLDFPAAVRQVVEKSGAPNDPLVEEFTLILQSLHLGRTRRQALEEFALRVPSEAVREFCAALIQAELRGNPIVSVLRIQAEVSRQRRAFRAEEAAARAGVAMILPLVLVFISILLVVVAPMIISLQSQHL
jgi:tight adherence protein C